VLELLPRVLSSFCSGVSVVVCVCMLSLPLNAQREPNASDRLLLVSSAVEPTPVFLMNWCVVVLQASSSCRTRFGPKFLLSSQPSRFVPARHCAVCLFVFLPAQIPTDKFGWFERSADVIKEHQRLNPAFKVEFPCETMDIRQLDPTMLFGPHLVESKDLDPSDTSGLGLGGSSTAAGAAGAGGAADADDDGEYGEPKAGSRKRGRVGSSSRRVRAKLALTPSQPSAEPTFDFAAGVPTALSSASSPFAFVRLGAPGAGKSATLVDMARSRCVIAFDCSVTEGHAKMEASRASSPPAPEHKQAAPLQGAGAVKSSPSPPVSHMIAKRAYF
jgi:hypothetical protein